jgi:type II secretory pathway component GspD/PulD (secretin)
MMKWFLLLVIVVGCFAGYTLFGKLKHLGKPSEPAAVAERGAAVGSGRPKTAAPLETPDLTGKEKADKPVEIFTLAVPLSSMTGAEALAAMGHDGGPGGVKLYASPFGNGVVLTGTSFQNVAAMSEMVKSLDRDRPEMVMVQAVILRTSKGKGSTVGIWGTLQTVVAAGGFGLGNLSFDVATGIISMGSITAAQEAIRLLGANDVSRYGFSVESRPILAAITGQEAWFTSGREIPVATTTQAVSNAQTSVSFKKVQFSFGVRPSVLPSGRIALSIIQASDDVVGSVVINGNSAPTLATQSLTTRIELEEGQLAILGGMDVINKGDEKSGVPLLGAVPPFSWMFGSRKKNDDKSELVVAVTVFRVPSGKNPMPVRKAERVLLQDRVNDHKANQAKYPKAKQGNAQRIRVNPLDRR